MRRPWSWLGAVVMGFLIGPGPNLMMVAVGTTGVTVAVGTAGATVALGGALVAGTTVGAVPAAGPHAAKLKSRRSRKRIIFSLAEEREVSTLFSLEHRPIQPH